MCPHCQADARFVERRAKGVTSLLGDMRLRRPYYHCAACHRGYVPWDETLRLGVQRLTPAAAEVAAIAGVEISFARSAEVTLRKMSGLRLSESSVERVTEAAGERLKALQQQKITFGPTKAWRWQRDARGRSCAYVGLDAISVRQQGVGAAKAEGRMACVALLYNPRSAHDARRPEPHQVRYLAGFYDLDELGLQVRRQAAQVGWDEAEQQIALSDGGSGLEDFFRKNFPRAECILDFWHAKEHLVELSKSLWPDDEPQRQQRIGEWCHRLKHEGGETLIAILEACELADASTTTRGCHADTLRYFRNQAHRMDYPRYLANGWQIGSGPVESACKTVVANRLKASGMRWGEDGADAVCHLRALYLSQPGQWESLWRDHPN